MLFYGAVILNSLNSISLFIFKNFLHISIEYDNFSFAIIVLFINLFLLPWSGPPVQFWIMTIIALFPVLMESVQYFTTELSLMTSLVSKSAVSEINIVAITVFGYYYNGIFFFISKVLTIKNKLIYYNINLSY